VRVLGWVSRSRSTSRWRWPGGNCRNPDTLPLFDGVLTIPRPSMTQICRYRTKSDQFDDQGPRKALYLAPGKAGGRTWQAHRHSEARQFREPGGKPTQVSNLGRVRVYMGGKIEARFFLGLRYLSPASRTRWDGPCNVVGLVRAFRPCVYRFGMGIASLTCWGSGMRGEEGQQNDHTVDMARNHI
jgi:hypothetical protein